MNMKDKTIQVCKKMWDNTESGVKKLLSFVTQKSRDLYQGDNFQSGIIKSKDFYQDNKEVCIGIGVTIAALTLIGIRMRKTKNNNQNVQNEQVSEGVTKKFYLDEQADDDICQDEISTDAFLKQMSPNIRKNSQKKIRQITEEDDRQDKIFYEMYSMYQIASQKKVNK